MQIRAGAALLCLVMVTACGGPADDAPEAADDQTATGLLRDLQDDGPPDAARRTTTTDTTTTAAEREPEPEAEASPATTVEEPAPQERVVNRSTREHDHWRVTATGGFGPDHPHDEPFPIEVVLENTGREVHHYQAGQGDYAMLFRAEDTSRAVWSNGSCNPTLAIPVQDAGAQPLAPGESVRVIVDYPGHDACFQPPGDYVLVGIFPVCPDDALVETANPGTHTCEEGRVHFVDSGGIAFSLR